MALKAKSKVTADKRKNLGVRPMEMLLGLGDCSAFDVALILRKGRQQVTDCIADIEAERADTDSKVFKCP